MIQLRLFFCGVVGHHHVWLLHEHASESSGGSRGLTKSHVHSDPVVPTLSGQPTLLLPCASACFWVTATRHKPSSPGVLTETQGPHALAPQIRSSHLFIKPVEFGWVVCGIDSSRRSAQCWCTALGSQRSRVKNRCIPNLWNSLVFCWRRWTERVWSLRRKFYVSTTGRAVKKKGFRLGARKTSPCATHRHQN